MPWVLLALAMLVVCWRRLPAPYTLFAAAVLAVAVSGSNLDSFERYALSAFPLSMAAALLSRSPRSSGSSSTLLAAGLAGYALLAFLNISVPVTALAPDPAQATAPSNLPSSMAQRTTPVVIAGAGPGGLTAAYQLTKRGSAPLVLEADDVVGGISRTVLRDGWRFDLGGHRFFTKVPEVEALWHEILPEGDFMLRPRMSRIFYKGKFYDYPLKAINALRNLGLWEAILCGFSYLWARIRPPKDESNYENWLVARFGWRLYRTFFKTYTEKVWGVPVSEMPADWAAQRIKNLDLRKAVINAILPKRNQTEITTPHRGVPVPEVRPRDDVGGLRREGGGRRGDGARWRRG